MITTSEAQNEINELISSQDVAATINEFRTRIGREINFEKVVLFGSRARGDNDFDSDIDIAVIVPGNELTFREKRILSKKLINITYDIELKTGLVINPLVLSVSEYNKTASSSELIKNIREDGVNIR